MINYDRTDTNSNMPRVPTAHVRHFARDIPKRLPKLACARKQQGALCRQLHPLAASAEKFDLHGRFKAPYAFAERGLTQSQEVGRTSEMPMLRDSDKVLEVPQLHGI